MKIIENIDKISISEKIFRSFEKVKIFDIKKLLSL